MSRFLAAVCLILWGASAQAFCGFYVAKADGKLYNKASKVVYVRNGRNSVITMSSDYRGAPKDFAMIIPTPKVLKRDQIRTVQSETVDHLDAYSAPRLVEYHDFDPCEPIAYAVAAPMMDADQRRRGAAALGVKIKGEYAVGAYDILILAAKESDGLTTFLSQEGYTLPEGAEDVLASYINMGMKFFVAKVNLSRHSASAVKELPPLQIAFRSKDFMLPIQLGKLNADGAQDALFMMLSKKGRVEPVNYPVVKVPHDVNVSPFVKKNFGRFYTAMFDKVMPASGGIVMEYAWDMAWCDPCAADPLTRTQLEELGVTWLKGGDNAGQDVYVTRLHARYSKGQMPQDIMFRETQNRENFQGRYVIRNPYEGSLTCEEGKTYVEEVRNRLREEAVTTMKITGWPARNVEQWIKDAVPAGYW